jgi:hypothetical protein
MKILSPQYRAWKQRIVWLGLLFLVGFGLFFFFSRHNSPRKLSLTVLNQLNDSLNASDPAEILKFIIPSEALSGRSPNEQATFARKALAEELSDEGLKALSKVGQFGPLLNLFPQEGPAWAKQAGVKPEDCVAFKAEREGIRTEVVLHGTTNGYLIVRCNNVRQLDSSQMLSK